MVICCTRYGVEGVYGTQDYSALFNLCTHSEEREPYDKYTKTIFAVFLLRCLQEVGYFKSVAGEIFPHLHKVGLMTIGQVRPVWR